MHNFCEYFIRCMCPCIINKATKPDAEFNNEEHHQLTKNNQIHQEDPNHTDSNKYSKSQIDSVTEVAEKLSNFLEAGEQNRNQQNGEHLVKQQKQGELEGNNQIEQPQSFTDVIKQDHPFYHLFKDKLVHLKNIFQIPPHACKALPDTQYPLLLHCYQEGKLNSFKYSFTFPTDFNTYESISNDFELQAKFDSNIQRFSKTLETPQGDAKLIYLSYKKVLVMSSRDFEYVRYSFKQGNQYWNICVSDPSRQQVKGKVRGELQIVTRIIEREGFIDVNVASTTDMKMPIKLQIAKNRGFAEIRKYLDKVYHHIKNNQSKSII